MNARFGPLVEPLGQTAEPAEVCARFLDLPYLVFLDSAARQSAQYSFLTADPTSLVRSKGPTTQPCPNVVHPGPGSAFTGRARVR